VPVNLRDVSVKHPGHPLARAQGLTHFDPPARRDASATHNGRHDAARADTYIQCLSRILVQAAAIAVTSRGLTLDNQRSAA
jgi:hypothetical protein